MRKINLFKNITKEQNQHEQLTNNYGRRHQRIDEKKNADPSNSVVVLNCFDPISSYEIEEKLPRINSFKIAEIDHVIRKILSPKENSSLMCD